MNTLCAPSAHTPYCNSNERKALLALLSCLQAVHRASLAREWIYNCSLHIFAKPLECFCWIYQMCLRLSSYRWRWLFFINTILFMVNHNLPIAQLSASLNEKATQCKWKTYYYDYHCVITYLRRADEHVFHLLDYVNFVACVFFLLSSMPSAAYQQLMNESKKLHTLYASNWKAVTRTLIPRSDIQIRTIVVICQLFFRLRNSHKQACTTATTNDSLKLQSNRVTLEFDFTFQLIRSRILWMIDIFLTEEQKMCSVQDIHLNCAATTANTNGNKKLVDFLCQADIIGYGCATSLS